MPTWKRATLLDTTQVYLNLDNISAFYKKLGHTVVVIPGIAEPLEVKEEASEMMMSTSLRGGG
jgi:hypothetical protein